MKKLFSFIVLLLLLLSGSLVNINATTNWMGGGEPPVIELPYYCQPDYMGAPPYDCAVYSEDFFGDTEYTRIYKEDGLWYGVIELQDVLYVRTELTDPLSNPLTSRKLFRNEIYVKLTRDTERLEEITLEYQTYEFCAIKWFGFIGGGFCTDVREATSGETTIYYKSADGLFFEILMGIWIPGWTIDRHYIWETDYLYFDYLITPKINAPIDDLSILRFTYVLTEEEVFAVTDDIQEQYLREVAAIRLDPNTTLTEKQMLLDLLNAEYTEYTIEYGESMESLCETELCYIKAPVYEEVVQDPATWWDSIIGWLSGANLRRALLGAAVVLIIGTIAAGITSYLSKAALKAFMNAMKRFTIVFMQVIIYWIKQIWKAMDFFFATIAKALKPSK